MQLPPEELAQRARFIQRNGERIAHVIDNVLQAARLEHSSLASERRPVSLAEVAHGVADALGPVAADAKVRLEVADTTGGTGFVIGDRVQLFRVLSNLVTHAIRHSPPEGVVTLQVEQDEGQVRGAVRDQGPGVPPEAREQIFERYSQGGPKPGATGLGLYVARQILELHGGQIRVEERPLGTGAGFVCVLPRMPRPGGASVGRSGKSLLWGSLGSGSGARADRARGGSGPWGDYSAVQCGEGLDPSWALFLAVGEGLDPSWALFLGVGEGLDPWGLLFGSVRGGAGAVGNGGCGVRSRCGG